MSEESSQFSLSLEQVSDYEFRIRFDDTAIPDLITDEPAPMGGDAGPNPSRLLVAAVANCLSASLLFALRKFRNQPGTLAARATATMSRNAERRWRVAHVAVTLALPGAAADYAMLDRVLAQFEDFCVVTESVRQGVDVEVSVLDGTGARLHATRAGGPAA